MSSKKFLFIIFIVIAVIFIGLFYIKVSKPRIANVVSPQETTKINSPTSSEQRIENTPITIPSTTVE